MKIKNLVLIILMAVSSIHSTSAFAGSYETGKQLYEQKKYSQSYSYLKKSLSTKHPDSYGMLGYLYREGYGVKQDYQKAFFLYLEGAKLGDAKSQFGLGFMYEGGLFVKQDYAKAKTWYEYSSNQGYLSAMNNLGSLYDDENTGFKNEKIAFEWILKAAQKDNPTAQFNIGFFLRKRHRNQKRLCRSPKVV